MLEAKSSSRTNRPKRSQARRDVFKARDTIAGWMFISPALLLFVVFVFAPLCATIVISFMDWGLLGSAQFAGGKNYAQLVTSAEFGRVLLNSLYFSFAAALAHLVFGLLLALIVNRIRWKAIAYFARTVIVVPFLIASGSVALIARYVLSPDFGPLNYYLRQIGLSPPNWLNSPTWSMPSLIAIDLWQTIGFTFIIFLVGLQSIPAEYHEAASIDGAGAFRRFTNVTMPLLSPTTFFASMVSFIGAFQIFTWPYVVTHGGPGIATETLVYYIYKEGFQNFNFGYGAAIGVVLIVILAAVSVAQLALSRKWVHYDRG